MAQEALEDGFRYIKIKAGIDPVEDIARIRAVRKAVGHDIPIGVDPNQGWSLSQATAALPALEAENVAFIEQPVRRYPADLLAEFRRRSNIPVVAHESVFTLDDAYILTANRSADYWSLTPCTHGGYINTRDILALARASGVSCLLGTTYELGVGSAFKLHIAATAPSIDGRIPSDIRAQFYFVSDLTEEGLKLEEGGIRPPAGPGLGVKLDEAAVKKYRVDGK
jgi:muconate cycloisomerase